MSLQVRRSKAHVAVSAISIVILGSIGARPALAQGDTSDRSVSELPRPGYEPKRITLGTAVLSPSVLVQGSYDTNVFATPTADDDFSVTVAPNLTLGRDRGKLRLRGDLFGAVQRYAENEQENVETYGASLLAQFDPTRRTTFSSLVRYERQYERRGDPEAENDPRQPPNAINYLTADVSTTQRFGRAGLTARAILNDLNYLAAEEADRDLMISSASLRGFMDVGPGLAVFIQPYHNRRDVKARLDRNGLDRDTRTTGALVGTAFNLSSRVTGDLGLGYFRANPDDPQLRSFSGIAANGSITWRPRVRTSLAAEFFRGDVATIRAGAIGRIDTRVNLRVDQEVRHNLIMTAGAGVRQTSYRGSNTPALTIYRADVGVDYLLSRHVAAVANVALAKRATDLRDERFERAVFSLGARFVY